VEVEVDHSGRLLPLYWELHRATVRRWAAERPGTPKWVTRLRSRWVNPTSPRLLERVARHFGSGFAVWLARVDGRPAASIVVLTTGREAQYRWGAMDKELAGPTHASDLLQRLAIEQACRARLARYDMGGAETGTPLARWKQKFGATPRRNHFLVAATPALHEARRLAGRALSAAQP
ncbi:MAG TPA: GNAT family N-acetyltransferase, partial [Acidimicrobiales bacterium]|nr:GNAT family N-acetyltransferase [Acidimicrobiales bacterium]